jgi:hypothetical protein
MNMSSAKLRSTATHSLKILFLVWLLTFFTSENLFYAANLSLSASTQGQIPWSRIRAKEDNFSILLPVSPDMRGHRDFTIGLGGERISEERIAAAYHNGVVYLVRMYEISNPQKFQKKYAEIFQLLDANESTLTVGGIEGKQYLKKGD